MAQSTTSAVADGPVSTLVYRSRAARPLPDAELFGLVAGAQARNRSERLTGLVVYDDAAFFQWLEGPAENLDRVMASIGHDGRHTDIEIIERGTAGRRVFPRWEMRLGLRGRCGAPWAADYLPTPRRVVRGLRGDPREALASLRSLAADVSSRSFAGHTAAALRAAVEGRVVPELVRRHATPADKVAEDPRAPELAHLLLGEGTDAAAALLGEAAMTAAAGDRRRMIHLLEGAARRLGDLWDEDACTGFDVDLGLFRMLSLSREASAGVSPPPPFRLPPEVLVAPAPGEAHLFGAALASDELWRSGWAPRGGYPDTDAALADLLAAVRFDAVVLWLSPALRREHRLAALAATVAAVRRASRNPHLRVLVGGRAFARPGDGVGVGADMHLATAAGVGCTILRDLPGTVVASTDGRKRAAKPGRSPLSPTARGAADAQGTMSSVCERHAAPRATASVQSQVVPANSR